MDHRGQHDFRMATSIRLSISDMRTGEIMKKKRIVKGLCVLLIMFAFQASAQAPPCKGQNKNDPGCEEEAAAAAVAVVVDSVTVDWLNEALIVRGSGFTGSTSFLLGSSVTPLGTADVNETGTELNIPFSADVAAEVISQGNYNLVVDGSVQLSVFIESQIIDPAAIGCPCETDSAWSTELGGLWGPLNTACLEIEGPLTNDIADIAGTVLTNFAASSVFPHYPIGASFYPGDPDSSVCRLVQLNGDASVDELVNWRINENQQEDCALLLKFNICTP